MIHWRTVCVSAAVLATGTAGLRAQENRAADLRNLAILELADAGPDFADQGEYAGSVFMRDGGGWRSRPCGLQVAARGDGRFLASLHLGGLPGAGARGERLVLEGARTEAGVELQGDGTYVTLTGSLAKLASSTRQMVGELQRTWRRSPTLGLRPPANAIVLFDGSSTNRLTKGRTTADGLLMEGAEFATACRDFTLHLEFLLPYMPHARGQGRANSGVYVQSRYEVQILDSFALEGVENECGALYRQRRPDINMCLPPLVWQTYDIEFTSPRFDGAGAKIRNARLSVRHNGTLIHDHVEVPGKTGAGSPEGPRLLPTRLQDHGNPVRFRNIWLVDRERTTEFIEADLPSWQTAGSPVWSRPASRGSWRSAGSTTWSYPATAAPWRSAAPAVTGRPGPSSPASLPAFWYPEPQTRPWFSGPSAPFHPGLYAPYYRNFGPQYGIPVYGVSGW